MAAGKQPESVTDKKWRLEQIRDQINEFEQWFHPAVDEVAHLLCLAREWAKLADLELSEKDFANNKQYQRAWKDSMFPPLIRFCKGELAKIIGYCERRELSGKGTLRNQDIQSIKQLSQADDLESVEQLCLLLVYVDIADALARIMLISYRALNNPGTLNDLSISELRGDLLEVIARTYADINAVLREQAEKGIKQGLDQVNIAIKARNAVSKLTDEEMKEMKSRALQLKCDHPKWKASAFANQLNKEFPAVAVNTIRKYDWLIKLATP